MTQYNRKGNGALDGTEKFSLYKDLYTVYDTEIRRLRWLGHII
jgi:hypothetical protein